MNAISKLREEARQTTIMRDALLRRFPALAEDEQALADTLDGESNLDRAVEAVVSKVIENETMASAIGERIKALQERKRRLEETADTMRGAVLEAMETARQKKFTFPEATISISAPVPSAIVTDETAAVQAGYGEMVPKVDRTAIRNALKGGAAMTFATLNNGAPRLMLRRS